MNPGYGGDSKWNVDGCNGKNPWEDNNISEAVKGWHTNRGEWKNNFNVCQPTWGGPNSYSWKKHGGVLYDSRHKTSRLHGDADHGEWRDRGGRRNMTDFAYEKPALRQWNMKSCEPVKHHESVGKRGNQWSWE